MRLERRKATCIVEISRARKAETPREPRVEGVGRKAESTTQLQGKQPWGRGGERAKCCGLSIRLRNFGSKELTGACATETKHQLD